MKFRRIAAPRGLVLSVLIFCALIALFWFGFGSASGGNEEQNLKVTRAAVQRAIVSCYAIEGAYPPNVKYLEDHYGVIINHDKYVVSYERAGSNIMPAFEVLEKGKGESQ